MPTKKTKEDATKARTAQGLVHKLINAGMREVEIAAKLDVSYNTVLRWRNAKVAPHNNHLKILTELARTGA